MSDIPGGILTPSQRDFLREKDIGEKSDSTKSMTRSRIVERIQVSYTDDVPLIAKAMAENAGYTSLSPERIVDVEDPEALIEGLILQVAIIRELAVATGYDPREIVDEGFERDLATAEDRVVTKAKNNPGDLTFTEAKILFEFLPQELKNNLSPTVEEYEGIVQDVAKALSETKEEFGETQGFDIGDLMHRSDIPSEEIAKDLPDDNENEQENP